MVDIIPAILTEKREDFEKKLSEVWAVSTRVQFDVIDGIYSETKTVTPDILNQIDTIVNFDIHLMVDRPEDWVGRCVMNGVDRVIGQVEMMKDPVKFISEAQAEGLLVGLGYDLETPLTGLDKYLNDINAVLLMAVKAGAQGRSFDRRVLEKIKEVRRMSKRITIIVDGGLSDEEIRECIAAEWAEELEEDELNRNLSDIEFAVGSELFGGSENAEQRLVELRLLRSRKTNV